jgi:hypothetical protein
MVHLRGPSLEVELDAAARPKTQTGRSIEKKRVPAAVGLEADTKDPAL